MDSELRIEVGKRVETMRIVETTLILAVTALHLAVVTRRIRANQLVSDTQLGGGSFKERKAWATGAVQTIGKLEAVIRLYTLDSHSLLSEKGGDFEKKISGGVSALFFVSR